MWARTVIDVFPGAGTMALKCMDLQMGYLGIMHSTLQRDLIQNLWQEKATSLATDNRSQLYDPSCAKLMKS